MPKSSSISIKDIDQSSDDTTRTDFVRNVILERGIELFLKKGFSATSMNDLAEACKVSKPALYHYVSSKAALLELLYDYITRDFFAVMTDLRQQSLGPADKLYNLIVNQGMYNIKHSSFLTVFWRERSYFDVAAKNALAQRERDYEHWVISIINEGQALGVFRANDSRVTTMGILGMLSTIHRWAHHIDKSSKEVSEDLAELVLSGLLQPSK